mmetsp:Transcript_28895/g.82906  ORF Transcript_28895/g.82906 Transcript_28895/m.82906 type:complete len:271 (-) Transcript_28895:872-1684(-)
MDAALHSGAELQPQVVLGHVRVGVVVVGLRHNPFGGVRYSGPSLYARHRPRVGYFLDHRHLVHSPRRLLRQGQGGDAADQDLEAVRQDLAHSRLGYRERRLDRAARLRIFRRCRRPRPHRENVACHPRPPHHPLDPRRKGHTNARRVHRFDTVREHSDDACDREASRGRHHGQSPPRVRVVRHRDLGIERGHLGERLHLAASRRAGARPSVSVLDVLALEFDAIHARVDGDRASEQVRAGVCDRGHHLCLGSILLLREFHHRRDDSSSIH